MPVEESIFNKVFWRIAFILLKIEFQENVRNIRRWFLAELTSTAVKIMVQSSFLKVHIWRELEIYLLCTSSFQIDMSLSPGRMKVFLRVSEI